MKSSFLCILLLSAVILYKVNSQEDAPVPPDQSQSEPELSSETDPQTPPEEASLGNPEETSEVTPEVISEATHETTIASPESAAQENIPGTEAIATPKVEGESNEETSDTTSSSTSENELSTKRTFKEKYLKFRKNVKTVKDKAKKFIGDILSFDLSKLNVRNITQFMPFYTSYQKYFNKKYKNKEEAEERMGFFKRSIVGIKRHNKNIKARYKQGINELSDMNFAEIIKVKLGFKQDAGDKMVKASQPVPPVQDMPDAWDWRSYGIVTTPRNQGKCGSCWSFAAATVLESHNMKRQIAEGKFDPKKQITVSEQNLIDCSEDYGTIGCEGGMPQQAFRYVAANKGINGIDIYPYKGKKEACLYSPSKKVDVVVKEGKRLKSGQDKDLATAIYNYGPVAIAIHVTKDMAAYKSGIFDDPICSAKKVNHAVVAIGYSKDYFIIRNSWGPKWGENGYIRISRSKENNCGISQQGYYPLIPDAVETKDMRDRLIEITPD